MRFTAALQIAQSLTSLGNMESQKFSDVDNIVKEMLSDELSAGRPLAQPRVRIHYSQRSFLRFVAQMKTADELNELNAKIATTTADLKTKFFDSALGYLTEARERYEEGFSVRQDIIASTQPWGVVAHFSL